MDDYVTGLRDAGLEQLRGGLVPGAIHYLAEEAPEATWRAIAEFVRGAELRHSDSEAP